MTRLSLVTNSLPQAQTRRARWAAVPRVEVGASVCILGHWRLGVDHLGDGGPYKHIARSPKKVEDGMIADTAVTEGLPLITADTRLRKRAIEASAVVWSVDELLTTLAAS